MSSKGPDRLIPLGRVRRAHGLRGEVRVEPYNDASDFLLDLEEAVLQKDGKELRLVIESSRPAQGAFLVTFEGIGDRDSAEALRGYEVVVPRSALPAPEPGEYYHVDLVGLTAYGPDGEIVGDVVRVERTPGHDLLVIGGPKGERLVPMVDVAVRKIDLDARRIDLEPWEEDVG